MRGALSAHDAPPTEAEWEYAARAGTGTAFYSGGISDNDCNDPVLHQTGWYCGNGRSRLHPVSSRGGLPQGCNAWGLCDMLGNVREWVLDRYRSDYQALPARDPFQPGNPDSGRVHRGGGYSDGAFHRRAAERARHGPHNQLSHVGFRPAKTALP